MLFFSHGKRSEFQTVQIWRGVKSHSSACHRRVSEWSDATDFLFPAEHCSYLKITLSLQLVVGVWTGAESQGLCKDKNYFTWIGAWLVLRSLHFGGNINGLFLLFPGNQLQFALNCCKIVKWRLVEGVERFEWLYLNEKMHFCFQMKELPSVTAMTLFSLPSQGKFQAQEIWKINETLHQHIWCFQWQVQKVTRKLVWNLNLLCMSLDKVVVRGGHFEVSV